MRITGLFVIACLSVTGMPIFSGIGAAAPGGAILLAQGQVLCPACGRNNPADARFCINCGARMPPPPPPAAQPAPQPPAGSWVSVGRTSSDSQQLEFAVNRNVSQCMISCHDGFVSLTTLWVREGANKRQIPVTTRLDAGQSREIPIGRNIPVTGFRLSHSGRGSFEVYVR